MLWLCAIPIYANAESALKHTLGAVEAAMTDFGSLGDIQDNTIAPNFRFPKTGGSTYLHPWSEIWIGDARGNVASAWDIDPANPETPVRGDWATTETGSIIKETTADGREILTAQYDSSLLPDFPLKLLVDQRSFSWGSHNDSDADDFIVIKLIVTNNSNVNLRDIYIAAMANWDVDDPGPKAAVSQDWVDWDAVRNTLFTCDGDDADGTNPVHTGLTLLDGKLATHQIFTFFRLDGQLSADILVDTARARLMSDPTAAPTSQQDLIALGLPAWDYLSIISAGPYTIGPRNFITVTFALVAGEGLADFQRNVDAARHITFAPQRFEAKVVRDAVALQWESSINPSVVGYSALRRASGENAFQPIGPRIITGLTFEDATIQNSVEYVYKIRPVDFNGQPLEFDSRELTVRPDVIPSPPSGLTATASEGVVRLAWEGSDSPVSGYVIYRNSTGRPPWTKIGTVPAESAAFVDANVYPGVEYFYTATASNRFGTESEFAEAVSVVIPEAAPTLSEETLDRVFVAPNPYHLDSGRPVEFRNLTRRATIRIYTASGDLVKRIEHRNGASTEPWDGRNENGDRIAPGVYVYHIESGRESGREEISTGGKFAVFR
jgi:hypothetical protein